MRKLSNKAWIVIAVILSLVTTLLIYNYLKGIESKATEKKALVIVAAMDIPPKTKITDEMIKVESVPESYKKQGTFNDKGTVIGSLTREKMAKGEQILENKLVVAGKTVRFSENIPSDKLAVTVAVHSMAGVAGLLKPGDFVDIVVTFYEEIAGDNVSHTILHNIKVLAINRNDVENNAPAAATEKDKAEKDKATEKETDKPTNITLAVSPTELPRLVLAKEKGKITLALRAFDMPPVNVRTLPYTPEDLVGVLINERTRKPVPAQQSHPSATQPPAQIYEHKPNSGYSGNTVQVIRGTKTEEVPVR